MFTLLGLAARARKVSTGETALAAIRSNQAKLVLIASDASANTQKKFIDKCTFYNIPYGLIKDSVQLSKAIGQNNRMVVAILDEGFATRLSSYLKG